MLKRPTTRANTASTDKAARAAVATQSGDASLSGVARCGSSAMNVAASGSCTPTVTNRPGRPPPCTVAVDLAHQGETPEEHAHTHCGRQPQPAAQASERVG